MVVRHLDLDSAAFDRRRQQGDRFLGVLVCIHLSSLLFTVVIGHLRPIFRPISPLFIQAQSAHPSRQPFASVRLSGDCRRLPARFPIGRCSALVLRIGRRLLSQSVAVRMARNVARAAWPVQAAVEPRGLVAPILRNGRHDRIASDRRARNRKPTEHALATH